MRKIEHEICDKLKEAIFEVRATNHPVPKVYKLSERDSIHIFSDGTVGYKLWSTFIVKFDIREGTVTTGSSMYWRSRTTNRRKRALQQVFGFPELKEDTTFYYGPKCGDIDHQMTATNDNTIVSCQTCGHHYIDLGE